MSASSRRGSAAGQSSAGLAGAMRAAIDAGNFSEALSLYEQVAEPIPIEAVLLRAYLELKKDVPRAIELLATHRRHPMTDAQRIEYRSLLGTAHALLGQFDLAHEQFAQANELLESTSDDGAAAESLYREGRFALLAERPSDAATLLRRLREIPTQLARVRALQLEITICAHEQRYRDQIALFVRLLQVLDAMGETQVELWAHATHSLATLVREMYAPNAVAFVEAQIFKRAWPAEFAISQFQALKALGWSKALQGDYFNAFRHLKAALDCAPSAVWRAMAHIDRAYLARCLGELRWFRQELVEAEDLAKTVEWESTRGEERVGLLLLAELVAPLDPEQAAYYLAQYMRIGDLDRLMYLQHDDRLKALAAYAHGVVQIELDELRAGGRLLRESYAVFDRVGYDWRAGRTALALFALTKERRWLQVAHTKLRDYAASWLGEQLRSADPAQGDAHAVDLTPVQSKVFRALAEGKSTDEIAALLGRSEFTVRNHIRLLLKAFNVNSRAALLAQAAKRGMLTKDHP